MKITVTTIKNGIKYTDQRELKDIMPLYQEMWYEIRLFVWILVWHIIMFFKNLFPCSTMVKINLWWYRFTPPGWIDKSIVRKHFIKNSVNKL